MRSDGEVTYFFVQHRWEGEGEWTTSDLGGFLFDGLSSEQVRGALGDRYRALMKPQTASSDLWQRYGIHGFLDEDDGREVLRELRALPKGTNRKRRHEFRLARRTITQETAVAA